MRVSPISTLVGALALVITALPSPATAAFIFDATTEVATVVQLTATDYTFSQSGFFAGAMITGTFSGADDNGDSQLSLGDGEVTAFSLNFSGNHVPPFTLSLAHLFYFLYDLDGGPLGDSSGLLIEGVLAFSHSAGYLMGPGVGEPCGIGEVCAALVSVPEPSLALLGAVGLAAALRRRTRRTP